MHRVLERFSAFAGTAVVLVYLGGLFMSTATYFVGHALGVDVSVVALTAIALAFAVEVHSFLSQRLTRANYQLMVKLPKETLERATAATQFRVHLVITCCLVGFSIFNSIAFWALILNPQTLADWVQVSIRGLAVPLAFLAAGFLTPLRHDATHMLQSAADDMLRKTVKVTKKQWEQRLDSAAKQGIDLAPVAVALMEDAGEPSSARRVGLIATALDTAEGRTTPRIMSVTSLPDPDDDPDGPGGGQRIVESSPAPSSQPTYRSITPRRLVTAPGGSIQTTRIAS